MAMIEADMTDDAPAQAGETVDPQEFVAFVTQSDNLAMEMDDAQLSEIGRDVVAWFEMDDESMSEWREKMEKAIDLAALVKQDKTYPFENASNIKYPLVTSAALQFNARAYPAIVPAADVVKAKVWGQDRDGSKAARGERVATYMTWQLLCEIEEWEKQIDTLLVQLPIVGDMFRKVWHDGERTRTKLIEPGKLVINAAAESVDEAPRASEEFDLYPFEIEARVRQGVFREIDYDTSDEDDQAPETFIEMHCRLDLDEDDYPEPYVVTVHKEKAEVVRIVADFSPDDVRFETEQRIAPVPVNTQYGPVIEMRAQEVPVGIRKIERNTYFVHYQFMPGMRGGLFGTGLGVLLSDISEAINTSFNMLMDAGHYASLGGGFIGTEFKIRGGNTRMRPGEYKMVNSSGQDIRTGIVERTFPGPDATLFQMLGLLIDAGKEISSTKDIISGESAQNMTATATMALIEQGMKVFTAAYKRIFRSLKREFKLIARINAATVSPQKYAAFLDAEQPHDPQADFGAMDMDVQPVADPNAVTKMQEMAKAQLLMELAGMDVVDKGAAAARILEAASIDDIEELVPKPDPAMQQMQMQDMQLTMALKQLGVGKAQADIQKVMGEAEKLRADIAEAMAGVQNDQAKLRLDAIIAFLEQNRADVEQAVQFAQLARTSEAPR